MHGPIEDVYQRIRGNVVIKARIGDQLQKGLSIIRSNLNVRDVQVDGEYVTIEFAEGQHQQAELLAALVSNQVEVKSYAEKEPTLEDVFMMVTKGIVS